MAKLGICLGILFLFAPGVLSYTTYYMADQCGRILHVGSYGQVRLHLSYLNYGNNWNCEFHIQIRTNIGDRFRIHFVSMGIESSSSCTYDYLQVYDGTPSAYHLYGGFSTYNRLLCGSTVPSDYSSTGRDLTFYFKSDVSATGSGFDIILTPFYTGYCGVGRHTCTNGLCIDDSVSCTHVDPPDNSQDANDGISGGAIAGIVIGVLIFICVVVAISHKCKTSGAVGQSGHVVNVATVEPARVTVFHTSSDVPPPRNTTQFGNY